MTIPRPLDSWTASRAYSSSDWFGAFLSKPAEDAEHIHARAIREGQNLWTSIDSRGVRKVDQRKFEKELDSVRQMNPELPLSAHLSSARGRAEATLRSLGSMPDSTPYVGPGQADLTVMIAQMTEGAPVSA